jgi:hypothetical protein
MIMPLNALKLINRRTVIIYLTCLAGILLFIIAGIIPAQRYSAALDRKTRDLQFQIDEQKSLQPIYQSLKAKSQTGTVSVLPTPERNKLSRDLISMVPSTFGRIAKNAAMDTLSVDPDVSSLANQSRYLLVHAVVRGDFFSFRKYLTGLGELPYFERIEEIEIQQNPDIMEFKMKIWLALN